MTKQRAARQCADCPSVVRGNARRCKPCGAAHIEAYRQQRAQALRTPVKHLTLRGHPETRVPRETRYIYRSDFLLALPEMRRALEAVTGDRLLARDYSAEPSVELPATGRRRSA